VTATLRFAVRVQPGARRTEVGGRWAGGDDRDGGDGGVLMVRVRAPAVDGKANAAVLDALADALGVRSGAVRLRGARGRTKLVEVDGVAPAALARLLGSSGGDP
jgi:uncharacterized protein YggU (UPF0235/DUF167 family)